MNTKTILFVHGLWMTGRCWEKFADFYTQSGYRVVVPDWPGVAREPADVRNDPTALAGLGLDEITAHYESIAAALPEPPLLIGHSFGGLVVQRLLGRGLGAAGVAIHAAQPRGVYAMPLSTIRACLPVLRNPANRNRAVPISFRQFRYGFANTLAPSTAREAFERYAIPAAGRPLFQAALANLNPRAASTVDFADGTRAPLLLTAGGRDNIVPRAITRATYRKYRSSPARTDIREYPERSHATIIEPGWEQTAQDIAEWAATVRASV